MEIKPSSVFNFSAKVQLGGNDFPKAHSSAEKPTKNNNDNKEQSSRG